MNSWLIRIGLGVAVAIGVVTYKFSKKDDNKGELREISVALLERAPNWGTHQSAYMEWFDHYFDDCFEEC